MDQRSVDKSIFKQQSSCDSASKYVLSYQSQFLSPVSYIIGIAIKS